MVGENTQVLYESADISSNLPSDLVLIHVGAIAVTTGQFSDANVPILLSSLHCSGSESSLFQCPYSADSQQMCGAAEDAAAICQGNLYL